MALALPSGADLLQRERQVRYQGTALTASDLVGIWQLEQIWTKGRSEVAAISSVGLRMLQARLILASSPVAESPEPLAIANEVRLAGLTLRFRGAAWLQGRRPLLQFRFDQLELLLGTRLLLQRALPRPAQESLPFFALIGIGRAGAVDWLAARGRGGGLALWQFQAG